MGKPDYCSIKDCHNTSGQIGRFGRVVKLHRLPKESTLRAAWLRAISRKHFKPTGYTQVCSDHFPRGEGRTSVNQVPTLFLPQKKEKPVTPRRTRNSSSGKLTDDCICTDYDIKPTDVRSSFSDQGHHDENEMLKKSLEFHSYRKNLPSACESSVTQYGGDSHDKSCQVDNFLDSVSVQVGQPEITIDDIKSSDEKILFYTGLPSFCTFNALFESLVESGADKMNVDDTCMMKTKSNRKLRLVDEFLMVMMRLRLGLLLMDLQYRFKLSAGRISRIFNSWVSLMAECLKSIVFLPPLHLLQQKIPACFSSFKDTRIILDCTEIFIETPSSLESQSQTYSSYKSHNTFKALIGISMTGAVVFVSRLWGGSASDVHITRKSGLIELLNEGDAVMVDKGFIHLQSDFKQKGIKLYCPPFMSSCRKQFTKSEVECTRRIASARIHVERKMEQIKNFRILQGILPISLSAMADDIFFVCSALTNLLPPLIK